MYNLEIFNSKNTIKLVAVVFVIAFCLSILLFGIDIYSGEYYTLFLFHGSKIKTKSYFILTGYYLFFIQGYCLFYHWYNNFKSSVALKISVIVVSVLLIIYSILSLIAVNKIIKDFARLKKAKVEEEFVLLNNGNKSLFMVSCILVLYLLWALFVLSFFIIKLSKKEQHKIKAEDFSFTNESLSDCQDKAGLI